MRVISAERITHRLRVPGFHVTRAVVPFAEWELLRGAIPDPERRASAETLFGQLHHLRPFSAAAWARANRASRHTLRRRVKRAYGHPPRSVLSDYLALSARRMQIEGVTYEDIARAFGYSDASTVHRSIRDHDLTHLEDSRLSGLARQVPMVGAPSAHDGPRRN